MPQVMEHATILEPTWGIALKVWWAFFWRIVLFGMPIGFAVGFVIGFIGAVMGVPLVRVQVICMIAGLLIGIAISIRVMRFILQKKFDTFEIAIIAKQQTPT